MAPDTVLLPTAITIAFPIPEITKDFASKVPIVPFL